MKEVPTLSLVTLKINNKEVQVEQGKTILDAAEKLNIKIPTLCYLNLHDKKTENKPGSCRVCVVEVEGRRNLAPACCTPATQGMVIKTNSPRALSARKTVLELLLSDHPNECLTCAKSMNCELQQLAAEYGIRNIEFSGDKSICQKEDNNYSIARDTSKCILCRRCETVCNEVQKVGAISSINRGFNTTVAPAFGTVTSLLKPAAAISFSKLACIKSLCADLHPVPPQIKSSFLQLLFSHLSASKGPMNIAMKSGTCDANVAEKGGI